MRSRESMERLARVRGNDHISGMAWQKSVPPPPEGFLTGQLLIAMPAMTDPRFSQSVIYVCAHTPDGAMGLVVNRPVVQPTLDDLLGQLQAPPVPPLLQISLFSWAPGEN